ncbi:MAG: glycosyltransferase [Lachnospiraceae bacterium]|mgnify:CR=1 FL=1|nr:glycosyltransferase [Lachnospiraceae bacterium]
MRILQINSHYNQGGAARIVACIHRQLSARGQESHVAYGRGQKGEEGTYRFNTVPEVLLSAACSRFLGKNGWYNRAATRRLLSFMERVEPDVIHLHALHGYYLNFPMLFDYINSREIPCVWTFHDCHAFTGNCGYFFDCEKWKTGCGSCPYLKNYPASQWFDRTGVMWRQKRELFTQGTKKVIVTPSLWLTEQAKQSCFGKYPCITIHNGIDTKQVFYPRDRRACREKYGFGREEKLILGIAVGYRDERKGAKYIIQLAKNLGSGAKVILIGWNRENDCLLVGSDGKKIADNIVTIPNTSDADMLAEYYSMADVFVIPSLAENYATTTLEAMACGTPAVGFDVGGIPEQLTGGRGIAVKAGDQARFDAAVESVLTGQAGLMDREALSAAVREENSTERMTEAYERIYRELHGD